MGTKTDPNLVWLDLEMTGLDPDRNTILEIATIVTTADLRVLGEGPSLTIKQSDEILHGMDDWNTRHHTHSGLLEKSRRSNLTLSDAETMTLHFLKQYTRKGCNLLCGNTINQDRRFLYRHMPNLSDWLHYRSIDVTSIKELAYRWYPNLPEFQKQEKHLALDDIRESIAELEYYRKQIFRG